jgi:hypothetical protein
MSSLRTSFRTAFAAVAILSTLAACGDDGALEPDPIAGAYTATTFRITPPSSAEANVLAQGGSLTITIGANNTTTGTLNVPATITGGDALVASMAGTVDRNGNGVSFEQTADTFVRDLNWTVAGNTITATNQSVGGAIYTIVLTR